MAKESWEGKEPAQWTQEEALAFFADSPWSHQVTLYEPSGRIMGVMRGGGKVVVQESSSAPPRHYSPAPLRLEPEVLQAKYGVRWGSAQIVQQGLARLQSLSQVHAEMQARPPETPADTIALTVRVVEPPQQLGFDRLNRPTVYDQSGRPVRDEEEVLFEDLFSGLSEEELAEAAELRVKNGPRLKPERAVRHGLGTSEGVTFYFPHDLPAGAREVQFVFKGREGVDLKVKFKLQDMQVSGQPDY
jgi:hypothetical protein